MTIETELKYIFDDIRDQWLEDNATQMKDKVQWGDTYVEKNIGYSNKDWENATQYAKEKFGRKAQEIINNN